LNEAERLDRSADQRDGLFETAVDQDVPLRCRDQVGCELFGAYVIDVPDHAVRREGSVLELAEHGQGDGKAGKGHADWNLAAEGVEPCGFYGIMRAAANPAMTAVDRSGSRRNRKSAKWPV